MKRFFVTLKFIGSSHKPPSKEGWIWTINGVERLWRNLVQKHPIKTLATRRLQKHALENLFGCIRENCCSNTYPTCEQFVAGIKTAILISQPKQQTNNDSVASASSTTTSALYSEVDEAININDPEIQACAYVAEKIPVNNCETCRKIFHTKMKIWNVFFLCMKRFCILKNRSFAEEASDSSLKRKVKIILHK
ncbi:unnamed protein product [Euphydryas editha]|uniref:Transposable element P transposase-like RNase H C-terminal domain-containing protein n=1 Tax=Euphydryas editha TaxID=104508 RepID=A0AAU9TSS1_EUPED|nr:unnamed protein product [Euphydryas editha]